jgi:hypothetical protein
LENLYGTRHLEELGVEGCIILQLFKKYDVRL